VRARQEPLTPAELLAEVTAAGFGELGGDRDYRDGRARVLAALPGSPDYLDWLRARCDAKRVGGLLA